MEIRLQRFRPLLSLALLVLTTVSSWAQQPATSAPTAGAISSAERQRALGILDGVSKGIQSLYYDPKLNGLDWNAVLERARARISQSNSLNDALTQIAIAVDELHDSHTVFVPPARPYHMDFGFDYQMFWGVCLVARVRPGSDAEAKGLKPGMQIATINGTVPSRRNLRSIEYLDQILNPQPQIRLEVQDSSGEKRRIEITAKLSTSADIAYRPGAGVRYDVIRNYENVRRRMRMQWVQVNDVTILRFPWFFYSADDIYDFGKKARRSKAMIVDLRGDQGGSVRTLGYLMGMFFDHDIKIGERVERKKTAADTAKHEPPIYFPGKLIVLVDSQSASASEIFARVIQLEKRGKVIGDRTSGSVMEATDYYFASSGIDYGAEVTIADLIMTDGKSLEHNGVTPDEIAFPQPYDLEKRRDPVLSQAAQELGATISPEEAGKLFPYEWPQD